jgi:DNA modification methylase
MEETGGNVWNDINEVTVGNLIHTERVKHPTQKPLKACYRIIKTSSNEEQNVLIPFAGSGSECEACEVLGRNWTAFENDQFSIDIIHERFENLNAFEKSKERGLFSFTDEPTKAD